MKTLADEIAETDVFAGLPRDDLELLAGCGRNVGFDAGELLFEEGEPADVFFLLRRGRVALELHSPTRGGLTIDTVDAGSVVGWSWLFPPYRWQFDARAIDPVRAVAFDGACLRGKCDDDPRLCYSLMGRFGQVMVDRLQAARIRLLDVYGSVARR